MHECINKIRLISLSNNASRIHTCSSGNGHSIGIGQMFTEERVINTPTR